MKIKIWLPTFLLLSISFSLFAYGPRSVTTSGNVVKWTLPVRIDLESDLDVRGKDITALINEGLTKWSDLSDSNVTYTQEALGVAVDADNVCCYLFDSAACPSGPTDDGTNPIVIDDDGEIVAKFFGTANKLTTLGFAAVIAFESDTGVAVKGEAVFNAACLAGALLDDCTTVGLSFSEDDFVSFIVHELGHFLGLNHSQVNLTEADDSDTTNDDKINTMYPFFIQGNGANFKTPDRDDQVGLASLYPATDFSSNTFTAEGTVFDTNGTTEFACANVIVRSTTSGSERTDAISFVSGQLCPGSFNGTCDGNYQIQGLNTSSSYTIEVEAIDSSFRTSSGIPPCESTGEQPTFTAQTLSGSVSGTGGSTASSNDFTLVNTSSNVNSLALPTLDILTTSQFDVGLADDAILAIEAKSVSDSCSTSSGGDSDDSDSSTTTSSSSSSGCSLIR